ncbi:MAG: M16 family metallopeptidase [Armatimonadota bacterium]
MMAAVVLLGMSRVSAQEVPNPFPADALYIKTLPNGLRLVVREDHSLPVVSMVMVVRGGSSAERNTRGMAHYLEHLVLQGTEHYPGPLAPQEALEEQGGISTAVTTRDAARFQATMPAGKVDLLVNVMADIALAARLTDASFTRERPTILAEIQQENDNTLAVLLNRGYFLSYRNHPYRYSPIGSVNDILSLSASDVRAFYHRWYVPNNMSVVLVGDVTAKRAEQLIQQAFGKAKASTLPARPTSDKIAPGSLAMEHITRNIADTYQTLAFPAPAYRDLPALAATDLCVTLLADGSDALLSGWLSKDRVEVKDFGIEFVTSRDPGRILLWAQTTPEMTNRFRQSAMALLKNLSTVSLPDEAFTLAKQRIAMQFLLENETYSQ